MQRSVVSVDSKPKDLEDKPVINKIKETLLSPVASSDGTPSPPTLPTGEEEEKAASVQVALQRIPSRDLPRRLESMSEDSLLVDINSPDNSVTPDNIEKQKSPLFVPGDTTKHPTASLQSLSTVVKPTITEAIVGITATVKNDVSGVGKRKPSEGNPIQLAKKSTCQLTCKRTGTGIIISKKSKSLILLLCLTTNSRYLMGRKKSANTKVHFLFFPTDKAVT